MTMPRHLPGGASSCLTESMLYSTRHLNHFWYLYTMALNIKDPETEHLATEVALLAHENKTEAIRTALRERAERLEKQAQRVRHAERVMQFLNNEAWPQIPVDQLGASPSKAEREDILGYGPEGV